MKSIFIRKQPVMEKELADFLVKNEKDINDSLKGFFELFNECGIKYNNQAMQCGFLSAYVLLLCKSSNIPKFQLVQCFKNIEEKLK